MTAPISNIPVGEVVMLDWNREPVQVIYQSSGWTTIKPIHGGEQRDVSTACEVSPYDGRVDTKPKPKPVVTEVTFKDFQRLMIKRKRNVDDLVDIFRGRLEDTRDFFERVMTCRYHGDDRSDVVIPYRSVIEFYFKETQYLKDSEEEQERLALKRKRGPVSEEHKQALIKNLEKARAARSAVVEK